MVARKVRSAVERASRRRTTVPPADNPPQVVPDLPTGGMLGTAAAAEARQAFYQKPSLDRQRQIK